MTWKTPVESDFSLKTVTISDQFSDTNYCLPLALGLSSSVRRWPALFLAEAAWNAPFPNPKQFTHFMLQNSPAFSLLPKDSFRKANPVIPGQPDFVSQCQSVDDQPILHEVHHSCNRVTPYLHSAVLD